MKVHKKDCSEIIIKPHAKTNITMQGAASNRPPPLCEADSLTESSYERSNIMDQMHDMICSTI